jgi:hypothetical protein
MGSSTVSMAVPPDFSQRLADQLRSLTEVAETLTLRLLELEDRLSLHEQQLQPLLIPAGDPDPQGQELTGQRLSETEQRLGRLESLLNEPQGGGRSLPAVPSPRIAVDPFPPEEGEQPFLDELEHQELESEELGPIPPSPFEAASTAHPHLEDPSGDPPNVDSMGDALDEHDRESALFAELRRPVSLSSLQEDFDLQLQQA